MASSSLVMTHPISSLARSAESTCSPMFTSTGKRSLLYPASALATATLRLPVLSNTFQQASVLYQAKSGGMAISPSVMMMLITFLNKLCMSFTKRVPMPGRLPFLLIALTSPEIAAFREGLRTSGSTGVAIGSRGLGGGRAGA